MTRKNWTREELLLTLNLYCKLPFGKFSASTPEIIELAEFIGRTPGAVAMKLSNFASLDDSLHQVGLPNASRLDKAIWAEFTSNWDQAVLESESLLDSEVLITTDLKTAPMVTETSQTLSVRRGQNFFRLAILNNYNKQCCICNLPIESLLIASHIVPWNADKTNRLNPHNGMCLCAIHDKAFDRGFLTLDEEYRILFADDFKYLSDNQAIEQFFMNYQYKTIQLPEKFTPAQEFLEYHRSNIFLK